MLKTNSKVVKERIRKLIVDVETLENYGVDTTGWNWMQIANKIREIALDEKSGGWYCHNMTPRERFTDWMGGLPSAFDCSWYYRDDAVGILGDILEETEYERSKYSEERAIDLLAYLIWREMEYAHRKIGG